MCEKRAIVWGTEERGGAYNHTASVGIDDLIGPFDVGCSELCRSTALRSRIARIECLSRVAHLRLLCVEKVNRVFE